MGWDKISLQTDVLFQITIGQLVLQLIGLESFWNSATELFQHTASVCLFGMFRGFLLSFFLP